MLRCVLVKSDILSPFMKPDFEYVPPIFLESELIVERARTPCLFDTGASRLSPPPPCWIALPLIEAEWAQVMTCLACFLAVDNTPGPPDGLQRL
jgi:hypothetical protein